MERTLFTSMAQDKTNITDQELVDTELNPSPPQKFPITGRFDQYRSSYWAAALAMIGIRYAPRPWLKTSNNWDNKNGGNFYKKHLYAAFAGAVMQGVAGFFAYRTYNDMHTIFAQTLAWEFDKDPKKITIADFRRSQNTMVQQTWRNYVDRNRDRFTVNMAFFLPYIVGPILKKTGAFKGSNLHPDRWSSESGADIGIATNSAYLFRDVLIRRMSTFESLQHMIDRKINHADSFADQIESADLLDVYERHAANGPIKSFLGQRGTPTWDHSMMLFSRMADLMNQTYSKTTVTDHADFTIPKFIYLVGHNMIQPDNFEQTQAYIEIANRYGIPALKKVVKDVEDGMELKNAIQHYPVALPERSQESPAASHAEKLAREKTMPSPESFVDRAKDKGRSLSPAIV